ncbi:mitotic-spindle organizing protein 1 [Drechslerella stenobrocha 248]|uniref:Mitotic-spindle organizing protein 1 n=1 Tax=Drechslerella stenobrocha 248 TaxID=1043628 RepID=W7I0I8_9PEZI|nr:mitotic-spindle organizing protein 1 [Drechslerella stenobrocha 248]
MSGRATPAAGAAGGSSAARQVIDILHEISTLLNTKLDRTTLSLCVSLIENGVNPEALAAVIKELRRESTRLREDD